MGRWGQDTLYVANCLDVVDVAEVRTLTVVRTCCEKA